MSYDLFFYKPENSELTEAEIRAYLSNYLQSGDNGWFAENEDTETYFSFGYHEPENENGEGAETPGFANTGFTFNINFIRPDFFGIEAFAFVDQFIRDLNLFVLNPQGSEDISIPAEGYLYQEWSGLNAGHCRYFFENAGLIYVPMELSNQVFYYNLNRGRLQSELGQSYYVPRLYFFQRKEDAQVVTLSTWAQHIPNVFPKADYFILTKSIRKLFRKINEVVLIKSETLHNSFGQYLQDYSDELKIIHPAQAAKVSKLFNSTPSDLELESIERIQVEKISNVKP